MKNSIETEVSSRNKFLLIAIDSDRAGKDLTIYVKTVRKLNHMMRSIIKEIRLCSDECPIKCTFNESKILSLLFLIFESLQIQKTEKIVDFKLSPEDIRKLRGAKVFIVQNIEKNYTLIELAHHVDLNDFKLKKGFKELFGITVFAYRHIMRMEKAKNMLQSGYHVNQVSEAIGYKHPHHFSSAFKAYFYILPSKMKLNSYCWRLFF